MRALLLLVVAVALGGCMSPVAVADCSRKPDRRDEPQPDAGAADR